jgi:hypothetical protein
MNRAKRALFKKLVKRGSHLISYRLGHNDTAHPVHGIEELHAWWRENKLD